MFRTLNLSGSNFLFGELMAVDIDVF